MDELPTTPVRLIIGEPQQREQESGNSLQQHKQPVSHSDSHAVSDSNYEFSSPGSSQFIIHPHEPLSKKREFPEDLDRSIDYGRTPPRNSNTNNNPLENIDINKMFDDTKPAAGATRVDETEDSNGKHVFALNDSPIRIEMSSPEKQSDKSSNEGEENKHNGHVNKKLKLQLESVPDLKRSSTENGTNNKEEIMSSPMAIDMIDTNVSPNKFILNDGIARNESFSINADKLNLENDINDKQEEEDFINQTLTMSVITMLIATKNMKREVT